MLRKLESWFIGCLAKAMVQAERAKERREDFIKNSEEWKLGLLTREQIIEKYNL